MNHRLQRFAILLAILCLVPGLPASMAHADENTATHREVIQLLQTRCAECHGPLQQKGGFRVDDPKAIKDGGDTGEPGIVAGKPGNSTLFQRISGGKGKRMPPKGPPLPDGEIKLIRDWIGVGAPWPSDFKVSQKKTHWSFQAPTRPALPKVSDPRFAKNPIDRFLFAAMVKQGLTPNPKADKPSLIRRVALDLTGLPPTPQQVQEFISDTRPDAYARMIERFLASPSYGERMARPWLDLARYADSKGFGSDPLRLYIWRYRDWVIEAFNRNLPYDRFTIEQLAGDMLPGATTDQMLATAFHRNTMTNTEGGTDDEEFRIAAIKDRVDTTMQVWMGLTAGCAKCHTHKFDPITHREYYQLFAIFNQTEDNDNNDDLPRIATPTAAQEKELARIDQAIEERTKKMGAPPKATPEFAAWVAEIKNAPKYWQPLKPQAVKATGGVRYTVQKDGAILAKNADADKTKVTVSLDPLPKGATGLRLEALSDKSLGGNGPGLAGHGNFVLSHLELNARQLRAPQTRFVRIRHQKNAYLNLAEVEVFAGGTNVALKGKASQSTTGFNGPANLAIDGNTDGDHSKGSVTHNTVNDPDPWWMVDLGSDQQIDQVVVHNRTDAGTSARLAGAVVELLNAESKVIWQKPISKPTMRPMTFETNEGSTIPLELATATHEQGSGFTAAAALGTNPQLGWALGGKLGTAQTLAVRFREPLAEATGPIELKFDCGYGEKHILGHFRVLVTTQANPSPAMDAQTLKALLAHPETAAHKWLELWWATQPQARIYAREIAELKKTRDGITKEVVTTPILRELPKDKQRKTKILLKGNFLDPGEEVKAFLPGAFAPKAADRLTTRLDFANWLVSAENPLTSRVAVNRLWAQIFGRGLVETEEDFGTMGQAPSHPELLDWLAVEFRESGWDIKKLITLILMSEAYAESSSVRPDQLEKDPKNLFLARAPRYRLDAESIRDQALALGGILSPKMFGPSVYPPQPGNLWQAAFNGERTYPTSTGEDRYRRGIYTFWRRTVPYPSMQAFDAPSREACTIRRISSNTPLQAFVTLNDPCFVEAAQGLAKRMAAFTGTTEEKINHAMLICLARPATPAELKPLAALYESERANYLSRPVETGKLIGEMAAKTDPAKAADLAALTLVANVLLNLDAVLTRN